MRKKANEAELLEKILGRLDNIDPPVKKIAVNATDASMNMCFVDVVDVCYMTTDKIVESQRNETAYVTTKNEIFFNYLSLKELTEMLAPDPRFMRTSKSHIVNLSKVKALKYTNARDLWFDGLPKPVKNAVTASYVEAFELRMKGKPVPPPAEEEEEGQNPPGPKNGGKQNDASSKRKKR